MLIRTKKGELKEIIYDSKQLYNYGINRLSSRDYSRKELEKKMKRLQPDIAMITPVLDKLEEQGYLSDINRARSLLNQFNGRESINKTKGRIKQEGVSKELLEQLIEERQEDYYEYHKNDDEQIPQEVTNAQELLVKKYKFYNPEKKDKMIRFLASKGYKYADISKAVKIFSELEE